MPLNGALSFVAQIHVTATQSAERMGVTFAAFGNSIEFVSPVWVKQGFFSWHLSVFEIASDTWELCLHFQLITMQLRQEFGAETSRESSWSSNIRVLRVTLTVSWILKTTYFKDRHVFTVSLTIFS